MAKTFVNREAEAKLKQLLDGHGLSNNNAAGGEGGRTRQGVVLGSAVTRSLEQLPASRLLAASLDNLPGSRLPPRPASAVRRQLFTKDGGEGREARLRSRCFIQTSRFWSILYVVRHSSWHNLTQVGTEPEPPRTPSPRPRWEFTLNFFYLRLEFNLFHSASLEYFYI